MKKLLRAIASRVLVIVNLHQTPVGRTTSYWNFKFCCFWSKNSIPHVRATDNGQLLKIVCDIIQFQVALSNDVRLNVTTTTLASPGNSTVFWTPR